MQIQNNIQNVSNQTFDLERLAEAKRVKRVHQLTGLVGEFFRSERWKRGSNFVWFHNGIAIGKTHDFLPDLVRLVRRVDSELLFNTNGVERFEPNRRLVKLACDNWHHKPNRLVLSYYKSLYKIAAKHGVPHTDVQAADQMLRRTIANGFDTMIIIAKDPNFFLRSRPNVATLELVKGHCQEREDLYVAAFYRLKVPSPGKVCQTCDDDPSSLRECGSCHKVLYCSLQCQKHDWPLHKATCMPS
jgi:hypothetical protein